jgi:signal transduction histidine kinase
MTQQFVRAAKSNDPGGGTSRLRSRSASWLAFSLAALCVAMFIANVVLYFLARAEQGVPSTLGTRLTLIDLLVYVPVLVFPIVGALIASRRPHNPIGWICLAQGLLFVLYGTIIYYSMHGLAKPGSLPFPVGIAALSQWLWVPTVGLLSIYLVLLFPDGRLPSRRWHPLAWVAGALILLESIAEGLAPGPLSDMEALSYPRVGDVRNPFGLEGQPWVVDAANVLLVLLLLCILASALSLILRYKRSSGEVRQQIKWIALAASVVGTMSVSVMVISLIVLYFAPESWGSVDTAPFWLALLYYVWLLSFAGVPVAVGFAVLKYRLYDIDFLINRTLVYGALTATVVGLYVLLVGGLGTLFQVQVGLTVSLAATGVVAVLFAPLRDSLQRAVNRLMYGERDDPYAVLSRLGRQLEGTLAPEEALSTIVKAVAQALKLPYAAIELNQGGKFVTAAEHGRPAEEDHLVLPLVYQSEEVGRLVVAPRAPGEAFASADRRLLDDLAHQAGAAAHAARLTADLQRSRERLVTAREEERRRLRRDLHDGLGPTLGGLTLGLDAARTMVIGNPAAEELLIRLKEESRDAVSDVRRLVYGLRPPALDDLGLVAAIRQQAAKHGRLKDPSAEAGGPNVENGLTFSVEASEDLPPLPAALEVAVYRITQEAMANVGRHAKASSCSVHLSANEATGLLVLEVTDDGVGMPEGRRAGVGMSSMRERVEELGGTLRVEPLGEGGTRVLACLRLPAKDANE